MNIPGVQAGITFFEEDSSVATRWKIWMRGGEVEPGQFHTCERGLLLIVAWCLIWVPVFKAKKVKIPGGAESIFLMKVDGLPQQTSLYGEF